MFGSSADFYSKEVELYHCRGALVLFDGMASLESLWELLLDAVSRRTPALDETPGGSAVFDLLLHHSGLPAESSPVETLDDLTRRLTAGMAVLLLDGCAQGIAFSVQSLKFRSVEEPAGEGNLRGSREGFADLLRVNLSLLRRLIRTEQLVQEVTQADCEMKTEYALCYCKGKVSPGALAPGTEDPGAGKAGAAAGFQLFCALALSVPLPAVFSSQLYRAPGGGGGKTLRGENHCSGQRQSLCHDFAHPFLRKL